MTSHPISEVRVGDQFIIFTTVANPGYDERELVAITQVADSEGVVESIGIISEIVSVNSSIKVGMSWTPLHAGNYQLKTFAVSDLEHPIILATPSVSNITVVSSQSQNTTLSKLKVTVGPGTQPQIESLLIGVNVTDNQGNPVEDATVSATITNSSGYRETFSGQTNSAGSWTFSWQVTFNYKAAQIHEMANILANVSKYCYEDGSAEVNVNWVT